MRLTRIYTISASIMFVELAESDLYCAIEPEKSSKEYAN